MEVHQILNSFIINGASSIFNKIDGSNDIGLDGYVEFVEKESVTGLCVGIQVKSGDTYQNHNQTYAVIKADKEHFEYWKSHVLPIARVVYIPNDNAAYWIDITAYLNENTNVIDSGPFTFRVPKENVFSVETFETFYRKFLTYKDVYTQDWNFGKALRSIVNFQSYNERIDSLKSLFYFHRNQKETWHYIIQQFRIEDDVQIQSILIFILRHLINHGDIYWHKDNVINEDARSYGRSLIKKYFHQAELHKLLNHIDENGISRGSI